MCDGPKTGRKGEGERKEVRQLRVEDSLRWAPHLKISSTSLYYVYVHMYVVSYLSHTYEKCFLLMHIIEH